MPPRHVCLGLHTQPAKVTQHASGWLMHGLGETGTGSSQFPLGMVNQSLGEGVSKCAGYGLWPHFDCPVLKDSKNQGLLIIIDQKIKTYQFTKNLFIF